jgi:YD repeat-containing protein
MRTPGLKWTVFAAGLFALAALCAGAPTDRSLSTTGTVAKIQASERAVTVKLPDGTETRFVWTADTKISGVLTLGAKVTIRYETAADGRHVAQQISVSRS